MQVATGSRDKREELQVQPCKERDGDGVRASRRLQGRLRDWMKIDVYKYHSRELETSLILLLV